MLTSPYFFINSIFLIIPIYSNIINIYKNRDIVKFNLEIISNYKFILINFVLVSISFLLIVYIIPKKEISKNIEYDNYSLNNAAILEKELNNKKIDCGFNNGENLYNISNGLVIKNNTIDTSNRLFKIIENEYKTDYAKNKYKKISDFSPLNGILWNKIKDEVNNLDLYIKECLGYNLFINDEIKGLLQVLYFKTHIDTHVSEFISSNGYVNKAFEETQKIQDEVGGKIYEHVPFIFKVSNYISNKLKKEDNTPNGKVTETMFNFRLDIISELNKKIEDDINFVINEKFHIDQEDINVIRENKDLKVLPVNHSEYTIKDYMKKIEQEKVVEEKFIDRIKSLFKELRNLKNVQNILDIYNISKDSKSIFIEKNLSDYSGKISTINYLGRDFNFYFNNSSNKMNYKNNFEKVLKQMFNEIFFKLDNFNENNISTDKYIDKNNILKLELIQTHIENYGEKFVSMIYDNSVFWNNLRYIYIEQYADLYGRDSHEILFTHANDLSYNEALSIINEKKMHLNKYFNNKKNIVMSSDDLSYIVSKIKNIFNKLRYRYKFKIDFLEKDINQYFAFIKNDIDAIVSIFKKYNIENVNFNEIFKKIFKDFIYCKSILFERVEIEDSYKEKMNKYQLFYQYFLSINEQNLQNIIKESYSLGMIS